MADKTDVTIERVFALLDRWRHLPAYQLEPRAGVFFALFLPEVLGAQLSGNGRSIEIDCRLIPEFPIKKSGSNQSTKVDYLVLSRDRKLAFLVELKTDMASKLSPHGIAQQRLLIDTATQGSRSLIDNSIGILRRHPIVRQTRQKYVHLVHCLDELGLISLQKDDLYRKAFAAKQDGIYRLLETVRVAETMPELKVLYVQPTHHPSDRTCVVDFSTFAGIVEEGQEGEDARKLFARHLRYWASRKAGSVSPLDWQS